MHALLNSCFPWSSCLTPLLIPALVSTGAKSAKVEAARKAKAAARPAVKKVSKAFYSTMITDSGAPC